MTNQALPGFSGEAVAAVNHRLDEAAARGVTILLAVESGSRAWGFPSPDSDYDCRFVYARHARDHVRFTQPRDVIEFPIEGEIDVNGWDLRKALLLALSGNAAIVEWVSSKLVYRQSEGFAARMTALFDRIMDPERVARHYLGLARTQLHRHEAQDGGLPLKKLFYGLRPLIALDWMEDRGFKKLPPMNMLACMDGVDLPTGVREATVEMIEQKAKRLEIATGTVPPAILHYMSVRLEHHGRRTYPAKAVAQTDARYEIAQEFYSAEVEQLG